MNVNDVFGLGGLGIDDFLKGHPDQIPVIGCFGCAAKLEARPWPPTVTRAPMLCGCCRLRKALGV